MFDVGHFNFLKASNMKAAALRIITADRISNRTPASTLRKKGDSEFLRNDVIYLQKL